MRAQFISILHYLRGAYFRSEFYYKEFSFINKLLPQDLEYSKLQFQVFLKISVVC